MSHVPSPWVGENGSKVIRPSKPIRAYDQGHFDTANEAWAYERLDNDFSGNALEQFRHRNYMSSGRYVDTFGETRFNPTTYLNWSIHVDYITPYSKMVVEDYDGKFTVRYRGFGFGYLGGHSTGWGSPWEQFVYEFPSGHASAIANRAIVDQVDLRARSEILQRARNSKFDVSEALAGLDLTYGMVANKVIQVILAWRSVGRGDLPAALRHLGFNPFKLQRKWLPRRLVGGRSLPPLLVRDLKSLPRNPSIHELWLALIYGWLPLLSDISDGVNTLNTGLARPDSTFTVKRRVSGSLPFFDWMLNPNDDPWTNPRLSHEARVDVSYKYRLRVKDQFAAAMASLALDNPLYSFWVAMPYSFVIDWLSPIGTWLQALSAPMALQFVDGYRSRHIEYVLDWTVGPFAISESDPKLRMYSGPAKARMKGLEFKREQLFDFPIVQPYFRLPFNPTRAASAVSLLATAKQHKGRV